MPGGPPSVFQKTFEAFMRPGVAKLLELKLDGATDRGGKPLQDGSAHRVYSQGEKVAETILKMIYAQQAIDAAREKVKTNEAVHKAKMDEYDSKSIAVAVHDGGSTKTVGTDVDGDFEESQGKKKTTPARDPLGSSKKGSALGFAKHFDNQAVAAQAKAEASREKSKRKWKETNQKSLLMTLRIEQQKQQFERKKLRSVRDDQLADVRAAKEVNGAKSDEVSRLSGLVHMLTDSGDAETPVGKAAKAAYLAAAAAALEA
jgi:hypothetical protein